MSPAAGRPLAVGRFDPAQWRTYRDLRLRALEESPDAFGSTLARERGLNDDEWARRLARGVASPDELPLLARLGEEPIGLLWARLEGEEGEVAMLYQMWTAPEARRRGAARATLAEAEAWARTRGALRLALGVTVGLDPATRLYRSFGFEPVGEPGPLRPGSELLSRILVLELSPDPT